MSIISFTNRKKYILLATVTILLNYSLDQLGKFLANKLLKGEPPLSFLGNFFVLTYAENSGAFLGLGSSFNIIAKYIIMIILPLGVCLYGIYWCFFKEKMIAKCIILSTIIGGGLGNLIDRIIHNFTVIDFLNFGIGNLRTGVLNIADISVTFGVILFVIYDFYYYPRTS